MLDERELNVRPFQSMEGAISRDFIGSYCDLESSLMCLFNVVRQP